MTLPSPDYQRGRETGVAAEAAEEQRVSFYADDLRRLLAERP